MTDTCETVVVVRKDHPNGSVEINKSDLQPGDVLFKEESEDPKEGSVAWLRLQLDNAGAEYLADAKKADLVALYEGLTE